MLFILKAVLVFGLPASVLGQYGSGSSSSSSVASSSTASSTASTSSAAAAPSGVHVVEVGPTLAFNPDSIVAAVGEKVEFQFNSLNHSVVQSSFDAPCVPLNGGFFSGFMPVAQGSVGPNVFTVTINNTSPIWFYCAQTELNHCQSGMAGVFNVNTTQNSSRSLDAYKAAAKSTTSKSPLVVEGGAIGPAASVSGPSSSSSSSSSGSSSSSPSPSSSSKPNGAGMPTASTVNVAFVLMMVVLAGSLL